MTFFDGSYDLHLVLGAPDVEPVWRWDRWLFVHELFQPMLKSARGSTGVRCGQYVPHGDKFRHKYFGRLGWNKNSHQKWCHRSPLTIDVSDKWKFGNLEAWAPHWSTCEKDGLAPDIYLNVTNEAVGAGYGKTLAFNPVVICAARLELSSAERESIKDAMTALGNHLKCKLIASTQRHWGIATSAERKSFTHAINDMPWTNTFVPEDRHGGRVDKSLLIGDWEPLN